MAENLLKNPGFDDGAHHQTFAEITVPDDWTAFWYEGPAPHDSQNVVGYCRPEMKVIPDEPPFKAPNRVRSDTDTPTPKKAFMYFAFGKIMDAGLYQRVMVQPGAQVRATAWAHGWSNDGFRPGHPHKDEARWSDGQGVGYAAFAAGEGSVTDAAARNLRFRVGIDPTGGTDARAATVVWGQAMHIYNAYAQLPAVQVVAQSPQVTVFLRCDALWPYKHNDAYWDDAELVVVAAPQAQLSLRVTPIVGAAQVGSAVLIDASSNVPIAGAQLDINGAAAAPIVFDVSGALAGPRSSWRWLLVPDKAGVYTVTLSAADARPVTATLDVT